METDSEYAARGRAATRREAAKAKSGTDGPSNLPEVQPKGTGKRAIVFSLNTYKHHALGDYGQQIRRFGTTDSYSTQIVGH